MYTRRKIVLNLIMLLGSASSMQIQKTMFLYSQILNNPEKEPYQFFPNIKGCYSLTLSNDYHAMNAAGLLDYDSEEKRYSVAKNIDHDTFAVDYDISNTIREVCKKYGNLNDNELAAITYEKKPFYAIRSEIINQLELSDSFFERFNRIKQKINSYPKTIYTIGYEGSSIDNIIRNLLYRNIKILIDVRKNAFSMRREFSKSNLANALAEAEIKYIHCPEVGIESEKRNEMLPAGRRQELFKWYEENTLPNKLDFIEMVDNLLKKESVVFLCYEKNPRDCHRSHLASFCSNYIPLEHEVINL